MLNTPPVDESAVAAPQIPYSISAVTIAIYEAMVLRDKRIMNLDAVLRKPPDRIGRLQYYLAIPIDTFDNEFSHATPDHAGGHRAPRSRRPVKTGASTHTETLIRMRAKTDEDNREILIYDSNSIP